MEDQRQAIGLFRYSLIRELADPELTPRRRGVMTRALAEVEHALGDGERVKVSAATLRRWLRHWRAGGFEALLPGLRRQPNRTAAELLEAAVNLKREAPKRTAAQVARVLAESGQGQASARTLQRHFARLGLNVRPDGSVPRALGRFEASGFGELWTGDGLHGPVVDGAKAVLFAFIDGCTMEGWSEERASSCQRATAMSVRSRWTRPAEGVCSSHFATRTTFAVSV
jgi:putative transposase